MEGKAQSEGPSVLLNQVGRGSVVEGVASIWGQSSSPSLGKATFVGRERKAKP